LPDEPVRYPDNQLDPLATDGATVSDQIGFEDHDVTHRLERQQHRLVVQRQLTDRGFERFSERGRIASGKSDRAEVREAARLGHAEAKIFNPRSARRHLKQPNDRFDSDFDFRIKKTRAIYTHLSNQAERVETQRAGDLDIAREAGAAD
jgi:hypothetical protein